MVYDTGKEIQNTIRNNMSSGNLALTLVIPIKIREIFPLIVHSMILKMQCSSLRQTMQCSDCYHLVSSDQQQQGKYIYAAIVACAPLVDIMMLDR